MSRIAALVAALAAVAAIESIRAQPAQVPPQIREMDQRVAQLALEAATRGPVTPIPLFAGPTNRAIGAIYDRYHLAVVIARNQIAAGQTPDAGALSAHPIFQQHGTIVVAYPTDCDGRPNTPQAIRATTRLMVEPRIIAGPARGAEAQAMVPGVGLPADALVVALQNAPAMSGTTIEIDFEQPFCRGASRTASLAVTNVMSTALARGVNGVKLPDEFASLPSPTTVRLEVMQDATGRARFPRLVQGPPELGPAAIARLESTTYPPTTVNGVPTPSNFMVPFVFTATGAPGAMAPFQPPTIPGTMATSSIIATPRPPTTTPSAPVAPAPPGFLDTQLARLAIEAASKGDPIPIPLDAAGPAIHGSVFDRYLLGVVKARAAHVAGTPMDPSTATPALVTNDMLVVAYSVTCKGQQIAPADITAEVGTPTPGPLRQTSDLLTRADLAARLPGVTIPPGATGRTFAGAVLSRRVEIRVTYADVPCGATDRSLTFPIQWVAAQTVARMSVAKLPSGSTLTSGTQVRLRGMVDQNGAYRFPSIAEGPEELSTVAATVASQWKLQPYRANGVAIPFSVIYPLTFTASGLPEPPAEAPPLPPIMTSSTINGRSSTDFTTTDVEGLSAATSKCEIAPDAAYGQTPAEAIKVGGSFRDGPPRARQYLSALRGPAGQGLHVVRRGSTPGPDKESILDLYEITYSGLTTPIRLFVDQYHEAPLRAPQGLTCASPLGSK